MSEQVHVAIVAGVFGLIGIVAGALLTQLNSFFEHRRKQESNQISNRESERAVLHGAFALCNFLAERLNDWDETKSSVSLSRMLVAQFYLNRLLDRAPIESERVTVSLVDLGLRLESLLWALGYAVGSVVDPDDIDESEVERAVEELAMAVKTVQVILDGELPISSIEELEELGVIEPVQPPSEEEREK